MFRRALHIFSLLLTRSLGATTQAATAPAGMVKIEGRKYSSFFGEKNAKPVGVKPFYLDTKAVTNAEYLQFVIANPKWAKSKVAKMYADAGYLKHWKSDRNIGPEFNKIKNSPVTNVSWFAAAAYAKWKGKRLPTLNEWESVGDAPVSNSKTSIETIILKWYSKPTPSVLPPVGSTFKNSLNVYDMHGLIWEWTYDFNSVIMGSDSRSSSAINRDLFCATGSAGAINRENYAAFMRFAFRSSLKAKYTVNNLGFRCAKNIG